jgi:D-3-phosphoglycerate dehydrogenase
MKKKIIVTTYPFGSTNDLPCRQLESFDVRYNDLLRKYTRDELVERLFDFQPDIIIAGTELYDKDLIDGLTNLKMIARVGIGLDSIPIDYCREKGISVTYTPDAPSNAVAELTICQMINMLRHVSKVGQDIADGNWSRYIGKELRSCEVGVIGCGRIGKLVVEKLSGLKPRRIFVNDIDHSKAEGLARSEFETKGQILSTCDVVTIHIPYSDINHNYISASEFEMMKPDVKIINMSRGGIINEQALLEFLIANPDSAAAVDTFVEEPYVGALINQENAYLTPHLGSCSEKSRFNMEMGAAEDVCNFIEGKPLNSQV